MAEPTVTIEDISEAIAGRGTAEITITIKRDGGAIDMTGLTARASVRRESDEGRAIHSSLEDIALTTVTAASGIMKLTLTDAMLQLMQRAAPGKPTAMQTFLVQPVVIEDAYYPSRFRVWVRYAHD